MPRSSATTLVAVMSTSRAVPWSPRSHATGSGMAVCLVIGDGTVDRGQTVARVPSLASLTYPAPRPAAVVRRARPPLRPARPVPAPGHPVPLVAGETYRPAADAADHHRAPVRAASGEPVAVHARRRRVRGGRLQLGS